MVVCSSCEVATFKVDLKVDNKMHTNNIVAQRCLQCWLSQLTLPIHGFKNIDSRTSSQLWYWLNMWWCSWLLLMSLTVFLCPVFVLTSQQNTVPLPLFYFLCFSFGSFAVVSVPLPLFRFLCHEKVLRLAIQFSHGWGRPAKEWSDRTKKKGNCCKPTEDPTLCSACARDSRKLRDYRETNLFSILTDFKFEYSMALSFCQPKLWWIILGLDWMGPSKVVTSQWRRSRSIVGRWVTHASVVETLGSKPKIKTKNEKKKTCSSAVQYYLAGKLKQFDKAVWGSYCGSTVAASSSPVAKLQSV